MIITLNIILFVYILYYFLIGLNGFRNNIIIEQYQPKKRFALIISAHNEENVIREILISLKSLNYPKDLYDIFLIADNCTDKTYDIGLSENIFVYKRYNKKLRGKGYAIEWILKKIDYDKYDAISVFDADNLVHKDFLIHMNNQLCSGRKVIQGYIESKNPNDTWISYSYSLSFWNANKIFQKARDNIGLSAQIGGTGFCISTKVLKEIGWNANCLTEDLEFSSKLILKNGKVNWCDEAIVYDEKPLDLKSSIKQRIRWMQGFADVNSRYFLPLLKKALKEKSWIAFDSAIYTLQPYLTIFIGIISILDFIFIPFNFNSITWSIISIIQFLITPIILLIIKKISKKQMIILLFYPINLLLYEIVFRNIEKVEYLKVISFHSIFYFILILLTFILGGKSLFKKIYRFILYSFYLLTWIPISIVGIINKNKKTWSHTIHTRNINIEDL